MPGAHPSGFTPPGEQLPGRPADPARRASGSENGPPASHHRRCGGFESADHLFGIGGVHLGIETVFIDQQRARLIQRLSHDFPDRRIIDRLPDRRMSTGVAG
jgi:hypothetical protein